MPTKNWLDRDNAVMAMVRTVVLDPFPRILSDHVPRASLLSGILIGLPEVLVGKKLLPRRHFLGVTSRACVGVRPRRLMASSMGQSSESPTACEENLQVSKVQ
jgi:hypothetical protein